MLNVHTVLCSVSSTGVLAPELQQVSFVCVCARGGHQPEKFRKLGNLKVVGAVGEVGEIVKYQNLMIITALHGMQTRSSDENSVCPSLRLSVKRVIADKMEERLVQIFISYERSFSLVF